ncbi:hypothetical protein FHG87_016053 [Trinorchestia longiramus]|nr:hypothetical protein FHG87_016053 [Trinorchestia longiramus]
MANNLGVRVMVSSMRRSREVDGRVHEERNARCVEEGSGMRYLVGLDEECNMTVVDAMKDFLVYAWNKRQGG